MPGADNVDACDAQCQDSNVFESSTSTSTTVATTPAVSSTKGCPLANPEKGMIELIVKWGTETLTLELSLADWETYTIIDLKEQLKKDTSVPVERQKFLGITVVGTRSGNPKDDVLLSQLNFARLHRFMLIGTPDHKIFKDAADRDDLPEVENDFEYYGTGDIRSELHLRRLRKCIETTEIQLISPIKKGKPLLVLDLDYTVLDCKGGGEGIIDELKRPHLDDFMRTVGPLYNIVIWSQTSWKWVEMKCTALGFLTNPHYSITFVLDRSSMFTVCSRQPDGSQRRHLVKALEIIWSHFPNEWSSSNTVHVDDLSRNFAFNPSNGLKVTAYRRSRRTSDVDLLALSTYLKWLSTLPNFSPVDHKHWRTRVEQDKLQSGKITPLD